MSGLISCPVCRNEYETDEPCGKAVARYRRKYNAAVASAAPELLEACKFALLELSEMGATDGLGDPREADATVLDKVRAAITKAEGRES